MGAKKTINIKGFTVVELTVALLVSAVVLATAYELFGALREVSTRQNQAMSDLWTMTDALEQIRDDLMHAVAISNGEESVFAGGFDFDSQEPRLLKFNSLCVAENPAKLNGVREVYRIEYVLVQEKDVISLYRIAILSIGRSKAPGSDTNRKLILNNIEDIKIMFYDGHTLKTLFSSKQNLPVYVEMEFTALGQSWPLVVTLPCGTVESEEPS